MDNSEMQKALKVFRLAADQVEKFLKQSKTRSAQEDSTRENSVEDAGSVKDEDEVDRLTRKMKKLLMIVSDEKLNNQASIFRMCVEYTHGRIEALRDADLEEDSWKQNGDCK